MKVRSVFEPWGRGFRRRQLMFANHSWNDRHARRTCSPEANEAARRPRQSGRRQRGRRTSKPSDESPGRALTTSPSCLPGRHRELDDCHTTPSSPALKPLNPGLPVPERARRHLQFRRRYRRTDDRTCCRTRDQRPCARPRRNIMMDPHGGLPSCTSTRTHAEPQSPRRVAVGRGNGSPSSPRLPP